MHIKETAFNCFQVVNSDGSVHSTHKTHREAWRVLDRIMGEPTNKQEDTAAWIENKILHN